MYCKFKKRPEKPAVFARGVRLMQQSSGGRTLKVVLGTLGVWKDCMEGCVAFDGNYCEVCTVQIHFRYNNPINTCFLGAFKIVQKATVRFVVYVCPSVSPRGTSRLSLDGIWSNFILKLFFFGNLYKQFKFH
jgi:hypothetical protein